MATDTEASGAAQLAGPGVLGPPPDRVAAIEVLRTRAGTWQPRPARARHSRPGLPPDRGGVLAATAAHGIAYVPYFPLGGFSPLQSDVLKSVAEQLGAKAQGNKSSPSDRRSPT